MRIRLAAEMRETKGNKIMTLRAWFLSDLHEDVDCGYAPPATAPACDLVVIAGDLCEKLSQKTLHRAHALFAAPGRPIIYVPGNHDFWKTALHKEKVRARAVSDELGIHLLMDGESVMVEDVRFIGATLWTDYRLCGDPAVAGRVAEGGMNDFKRIRALDGSHRLKAEHLLKEHVGHLTRIKAGLRETGARKSVVVTHHAPHPRSLRHGRTTETLDAAYASDLSTLLESDIAPDLWLHGHIHQNRDYMIGRTRIVSNPHGYVTAWRMHRAVVPERENPDFIPDLVIEI